MKSPLCTLWLSRRGGVLAALCVAFGMHGALALTVDTLRCDSFVNPVGIDSSPPQLSWLPQSSQRGETVSAYQIQVASSAAILASGSPDVWDSGQVASGENAHISYGGPALASWRRVYWQVRLWNGAGAVSPWSATSSWTMGILNTADWTAQWITPSTAATDVGSTLLRKNFTVATGLVRATVAVSGLGQCEMTLNGAKVSPDFLAPGWTMYPKTVLYTTYDITSLLQTGANAAGLMLGNGMYNIPTNSARYTKITQSFGARKAIAQIRLEYSNGTVQTVVTDATWKWSTGPVTFNTIYGGEDYDARKEKSGWNLPTFNDASWTVATVTTGPGGALCGASYSAPPMRVQQTFAVVTPALNGTAAKVVYDFGQNAAQIPTITVHGSAGATVTLSPSELGTPGVNGSISQIVSPCYMTYTLKGSTASSPETFTPRFFYPGYRYLQVALSGTVTLDGLTSSTVRANSDAAGSFTCSSALFNSIRTMIRWAQQSNSVSIFTDCPTREKLGWLEEIYLNGPSLRYEFDLSALYTKAMQDMADSQTSGGVIPTTAPAYLGSSGNFGDTPEWDSSFILSAWQQYQFNGDTRLLGKYYSAMQTFLTYLGTRASGYIVNYGLGDWYDLGPGTLGPAQLTPVALTATATYYRDAVTLAQIATVLGNTADAATYNALAANIRAAFNTQFYNSSPGNYSTGSQTSDAMPLELGLADPTNTALVSADLVRTIRANGNAMTSGDIGEGYLLRALTDFGRPDVAFDMHNRTTSPGYGYILSLGATSMTEGWDGSNSQDHFMLGEITEWFYHDIAGIQPDPTGPGFKKIIIKPTAVGNMTSASATYNSVRGAIASAWTITGGTQMVLNVTVPAASTAQIYLPTFATAAGTLTMAESGTAIMQNGVPTGAVAGVTFQQLTAGTVYQNYAVWNVGSGAYQFSWQFTPPPPQPTGLSALGGGGQVSLSWAALAGASSYNIKRGTVSGGPYATITTGVTATSYLDTTAANGTTYYYVVSAMLNGSESANSDASMATATANLGFELPVTTTYLYNPSGGSWTFTALTGGSGSGVSANGSGFTGSNPSAPEGKQVAFLQKTATITQTIGGLIPGVPYTVTFSAAQRVATNVNGQTWQVTLDGAVIGSYAPAQSATSYVDYTASFTATRTSHVLAFVGTDTRGGDNTVFLDNVRITPVASKRTGAVIGTPGSNGNSGNTVANVFDGDMNTFFDAPIADGAWAGLDFGGSASIITGIQYCPRSQYPSRMVGGVFQGANTPDFSAAVTLFTVTAQPATGIMTAQAINDPTPYLYVRYVSPPGGSCDVAEVEFDGVPSGPFVPAGLAGSGAFQQVALNWSATAGAASYGIKRASNGGAFATLTANPTAPSFTDSGLTDGVSYSYAVFAMNNVAISGDSNIATVTPQSPPLTSAEQAAPQMSLLGGGAGASISIPASVQGHLYQLQSVDDLANGQWQNVAGVAAQPGTGGALQLSAPVDSSVLSRFYRLMITLE